MARKCNCKADRNIEQLKAFFNRDKIKEYDSIKTKIRKHILRILGNIIVIVALPITIPLVLIHVKLNEKKGIGRVFKFNTNRWKAYINHELTKYQTT